MKLFFKILLFLIFCYPLPALELGYDYTVKTKGLKIGNLFWSLIISDEVYKTSISLKSRGLISAIYKFEGEYSSSGNYANNFLYALKYDQNWNTNKKQRNVSLVFVDKKLFQLKLNPKEKELPRINYNDLKNYNDPITSFINILLNGKSAKTIDGRRTYTLYPTKKIDHTKITIKEYTNIWADHKRNDLEYLEFFMDSDGVLPKKINIKFKGSVFSLTKN